MASGETLRILAVQPSATAGGAQRSFAALMRHLPAYGVEPLAAVLDDGPMLEWLRADGIEFVQFGQPRLRQATAVAALVGGLRSLMRRSRAAVVFSNMTKAHVFGGLAAAWSGAPAVWWQRAVPEAKPIERLAAYMPAAAVLASSDFALDAQRALRGGQRLRKVYPGVDVAAVAARAGSGAAIREALGWGAATIVGIVGRLERWKGQDVFLRAAGQIAETQPDARFLLVGGQTHGFEGDYPDMVRRLAAELGLGERVHFAGQQNDVPAWFDAMDVVVHASSSEAFGRVVVEAMALGKPVIATNLGGPSEIVEDGRSGLLIPPRDPGAMAGAMRELLRDPVRRAALGAAGLQRSPIFDERRSAEALAVVLREAAASRGRHPTAPATPAQAR